MPEKPGSDPANYNRQAQRLALENGWFWANQFDNTDNRLAHCPDHRPGKTGLSLSQGSEHVCGAGVVLCVVVLHIAGIIPEPGGHELNILPAI